MKYIKKFLFAIILFFLFSCSKHIPAVYEVVGMSLSNSDNTGQTPIDAVVDSVPKYAYAIKMTLNEEMRIKTEGDATENGFTNEDKLTLLNIYSIDDFDSLHLAGASLNPYFLTNLYSSATIDAFVSAGNIGYGKYSDSYNYIDSWSTEQYFYLMHAPVSSNNQSFVIEVGLSDGRFFKDTVNVKLY